MIRGIVIRCHQNDSFWEAYVSVSPIRERSLQKFTDEELEALPAEFRCFACGQIKKKSKIGGIERKQLLCSTCYPYLDDWDVGNMIKFDINRGFSAGIRDYPF